MERCKWWKKMQLSNYKVRVDSGKWQYLKERDKVKKPHKNGRGEYICSVCKYPLSNLEGQEIYFCPFCGQRLLKEWGAKNVQKRKIYSKESKAWIS